MYIRRLERSQFVAAQALNARHGDFAADSTPGAVSTLPATASILAGGITTHRIVGRRASSQNTSQSRGAFGLQLMGRGRKQFHIEFNVFYLILYSTYGTSTSSPSASSQQSSSTKCLTCGFRSLVTSCTTASTLPKQGQNEFSCQDSTSTYGEANRAFCLSLDMP